jgi:glucokinase
MMGTADRTILAIDLGGTVVKAGAVTGGRVVSSDSIDARAADGLAANLPRLEALLKNVCERANVSANDCAGLGITFPGLVDPRSATIFSAPAGKFADGPQVDLRAWASSTFGLDLRVENDAHAALLGEWKFGGGRGVDNLIMITLGTGIGTSVLINGRPLRGKHFQAGVLGGHFIIVPNGRPCPCGARGCVETECASRTLPEIAREQQGFGDSALSREKQIDFEAVFRLAAAGDAVALKLRTRCLDHWGALVVTLIHAFDPERVVIGGGVMRSADVILPHVQRFADANTWTPWGRVQITPSALGDHANLLGMSVPFDRPLEYL